MPTSLKSIARSAWMRDRLGVYWCTTAAASLCPWCVEIGEDTRCAMFLQISMLRRQFLLAAADSAYFPIRLRESAISL